MRGRKQNCPRKQSESTFFTFLSIYSSFYREQDTLHCIYYSSFFTFLCVFHDESLFSFHSQVCFSVSLSFDFRSRLFSFSRIEWIRMSYEGWHHHDTIIGNESNTHRKHTVNGKEVRRRMRHRMKSGVSLSLTCLSLKGKLWWEDRKRGIESVSFIIFFLQVFLCCCIVWLSKSNIKREEDCDSLWTALCFWDPFTAVALQIH